MDLFRATLLKEEVCRTKYVTFGPENLALFQYIARWYHRKRIHSSIVYKTPQPIEERAKEVA
ncbi:hypothetical protein COE01_12305 [Bacillus thuringiensis]|nr:hypothetical protein CN444_09865 [Bacillus thuringiensis]HDR8127638.1 hypothetical protein [Bacillus cereus]PEY70007.1 hypothetical protein CN352_02775 [Bacillus thuringiensis]PFK10449.1 hypothetical protein COJ17_18765 [Bacillus thuringiensis]PFT99883.1 hypothetical protein COK75_22295 [Bacillus thuringiensis]